LAVIREAYKKCALKYHPDKNLDNEDTTAAFQHLGLAWETLKDAVTSAQYDRDVYVRLPKLERGSERKMPRLRLKLLAPDGEEKKLIAMQALGGLLKTVNRPMEDKASLRKNAARVERVRRWKANVREDYLARLQRWIEFRKGRLPDCPRVSAID
jgi:curved DNA-binding protein CbpA